MTDEADKLAERLEAARTKRAAALEAVKPSLADQVAAAELEAANAEAIAAAAKALGRNGVDFAVVPVIDGSIVIVKTPDPVQFQAFMDLKEMKLDDADVMGSRCVHYPSAAEYRAIKMKRPALIMSVAAAASKLAGVALEAALGKA